MDDNKQQKIDSIARSFSDIMQTLGLDLSDESLKDTPQRVAKMYVNEIFKSLDMEKPKLTFFDNAQGIDQIVIVKNIILHSMCEHHFMPIVGRVHIGYIPDGKVLGLSKFNRAVQFAGARPQLQERIVQDIFDIISPVIGSDIIIIAEAEHFCSKLRGPKDECSTTKTSLAYGRFREDASIKQEFYNLLNQELSR